jgi:hypothetical protein
MAQGRISQAVREQPTGWQARICRIPLFSAVAAVRREQGGTTSPCGME